jgi:DNA-binding transcriptional MerR regulator
MKMRMQELAERSGLPKTTIHHYAREDLLPPARKTAPNAAVYDEAHLERLRLITHLREDASGGLSISDVRQVIEHVEAGVDLRTAVRLAREGITPDATAGGEWSSSGDLARAGEFAPAFTEALTRAGLIGRETGAGAGFAPEDLIVARVCDDVCAHGGFDPADLTPLADLIREVGNYSETLVEVHAARPPASPADEDAAAGLRDGLAELCDVLLWRAFGS